MSSKKCLVFTSRTQYALDYNFDRNKNSFWKMECDILARFIFKVMVISVDSFKTHFLPYICSFFRCSYIYTVINCNFHGMNILKVCRDEMNLKLETITIVWCLRNVVSYSVIYASKFYSNLLLVS